MRVFATRWLARHVRRQRIGDRSLIEAIERAERGLVDADLGGGLIKQRVARSGQGRSGGYHMLIAYRMGSRAVFLYAFAKNERVKISDDSLLTYREIGASWLAADARQLTQAVDDGRLQEVTDGEDDTT